MTVGCLVGQILDPPESFTVNHALMVPRVTRASPYWRYNTVPSEWQVTGGTCNIGISMNYVTYPNAPNWEGSVWDVSQFVELTANAVFTQTVYGLDVGRTYEISYFANSVGTLGSMTLQVFVGTTGTTLLNEQMLSNQRLQYRSATWVCTSATATMSMKATNAAVLLANPRIMAKQWVINGKFALPNVPINASSTALPTSWTRVGTGNNEILKGGSSYYGGTPMWTPTWDTCIPNSSQFICLYGGSFPDGNKIRQSYSGLTVGRVYILTFRAGSRIYGTDSVGADGSIRVGGKLVYRGVIPKDNYMRLITVHWVCHAPNVYLDVTAEFNNAFVNGFTITDLSLR